MGKTKKFNAEELAGFCGQIALLLKSGIYLSDGMYMLLEEVEDAYTKDVLSQVEQSLKENETFAKALKETGAFPSYLIKMVNIGEKSGKLESVMLSMASYYERESSIQESIRNVVSYPFMMFSMIAVILAALVGKILPMFQNVFVNLSVDVASSSGKVMQIGMWTGKIVAIICFVILIAMIGLIAWYQTEKGKETLKKFGCNFFVTKKVMNLLATGRFVSSMSVMVSSGMETIEAMELAQDVVEHQKVQDKIVNCTEKLKENKPFAETLREEKLLTGMQGRMLAVAVKSGMMEEALSDISNDYDERISNQLTQFCGRVETSLVLGLSIIVGGILISIMFPLVSIITSIG